MTQGHVAAGRVQKRLIHCFCQKAEVHAADSMQESIPHPEADHEIHPMKKKPSGIEVVFCDQPRTAWLAFCF